jgi:hypothetical protein
MTTISEAVRTVEPASARAGDTTEVHRCTPELRAVLASYADALKSVNAGPILSWVSLANPKIPRWIAFPAPRWWVSAFLTRYLYRCVDALKAGVNRRDAVSGTAAEENGDLEMLERFEESLPTKIRRAFNLLLGLAGVLFVAWLVASLFHAGCRQLLGDLATAVITLNRAAGITALEAGYRLALVQHPREVYFYAGAAMMIAWSAVVILAPSLPAFTATRRIEDGFAEVEASAFTAVNARAVHDVELDLIVRLLLMVAVALLGIADLEQYQISTAGETANLLIGALCVALTFLAGIELRARYLERRTAVRHCRSFATSSAFAAVTILSLVLSVRIPLTTTLTSDDVWDRKFPSETNDRSAIEGWLFNQLHFEISTIHQNAQCAEPHTVLVAQPQYLQFDLEVWSDVDQFANPATANALNLSHWSVLDSQKTPTRDLYMHTKCGRGAEAISQPIVPGAHTITNVVITAPTNAATLQLEIPSYRGKWRWRVPQEANDAGASTPTPRPTSVN